MAVLDDVPGPTNAGEVEHFNLLMDQLFKKTVTYVRRKQPFMKHVWEWQLHLFRLHYIEKRKRQDPEVKRMDFDFYTWRTLKRINAMKPEVKATMALHLVGDYKRVSLNPRGTTYKRQAAA